MLLDCESDKFVYFFFACAIFCLRATCFSSPFSLPFRIDFSRRPRRILSTNSPLDIHSEVMSRAVRLHDEKFRQTSELGQAGYGNRVISLLSQEKDKQLNCLKQQAFPNAVVVFYRKQYSDSQ